MIEELKLNITVQGNDIGAKVWAMYHDGEVNDGVALVSEGFLLRVVKLEREDGLDLAVEQDFAGWYYENYKDEPLATAFLTTMHRGIARKAYLAGRAVK
jgi:hypothetical protein